MALPKSSYLTDDDEAPSITADHQFNQSKLSRVFHCLTERRSLTAPFRKSFEWFLKNCSCKTSKQPHSCSKDQVQSNIPSSNSNSNASYGGGGYATKVPPMENANNYTPTTKVFKAETTNRSYHATAHQMKLASLDCLAGTIITNSSAAATNHHTMTKTPNRCSFTKPPLSPNVKHIVIKKLTVDHNNMDRSDVLSTTTHGSISTVTMDPALQMESFMPTENMMLLQSNRSTSVMALSSVQHETILSIASTKYESTRYHWFNQNHTIFTMDDSIWSACRNYEEDPIQNRISFSTNQFNISWHNIHRTDYNMEPTLSRVAPRQFVEI
jgi:hypothetical protein